MKLYKMDEPELEFGIGNHICPRAGIEEFGVYDIQLSVRRDKINVGAVGNGDNINKLSRWLEKCATTIEPKSSNKPNLFPGFCGFNKYSGFRAEFSYNEINTRSLTNSEIRAIIRTPSWNQRVEQAVELYYREIKFLVNNRAVDIIVCIIPDDLFDKIAKAEKPTQEETLEEKEPDDLKELNFRRALKAKVMSLGKPIQLIKESSLEKGRKQQDDATKAWNFCTALYYKSNMTVPWKLITNPNKPSVCYVGIGFYRSRDRQTIHTSLAQIFDELGNGVILRGSPVAISKEDRQPHLTEEQAAELLNKALNEYEEALKNLPARVVIHKSSKYNQAEIEGFRSVCQTLRISIVDFVTVLY
jgi:hypothetical protein